MKKRIIKFILTGLTIFAILIWIAVFQNRDNFLHIYFLDVGQGDSIYVRTMGNVDLLVDGGPDRSVLSELGNVMPFYDHKIDYVILSHPHLDHIAGLVEVIKRYEIGEIYYTGIEDSSREYLEFLKVAQERKIPLNIIDCNSTKQLDNKTKIKFYWPNNKIEKEIVGNLNNTSVVFKLTYNKFSVLFAGDIEKEPELDMIHSEIKDELLNDNILKLPHHGSSNISDEFISWINPDMAIISVGKKNKFGHPASSTLDMLYKYNISVLRTDKDGTIEIKSDGNYFWTKSEK